MIRTFLLRINFLFYFSLIINFFKLFFYIVKKIKTLYLKILNFVENVLLIFKHLIK